MPKALVKLRTTLRAGNGVLMSYANLAALAVVLCAQSTLAQAAELSDAAAAFGARPSVSALSLSPDGMSVAYIAPRPGQGSVLVTLRLEKGAAPRAALGVDGKPDRLGRCDWVSNVRLVCSLYGIVRSGRLLELLPFTRLIAVNADGSNLQALSTRTNAYTRGNQLGGGEVIDWLPDEDSAVLMTRVYLPDDHTGTRIGSSKLGLGVDRIDTRNLAVKNIEPPREEAIVYISDGRGSVRIMGLAGKRASGQATGSVAYFYRPPESRDWQPLGNYNGVDGSGFLPYAVDRERNVVYGVKKLNGRSAMYAISLDGSMREELVFQRPDVDVTRLIRIGRRARVVGVSYADDARRQVYFDRDIDQLAASFAKALSSTPQIGIAGSNLDESKLLIFARGDQDPGVYYLFDRKLQQLTTFVVIRRELEGVRLATVKAISYPARDGTSVPGYLTLPPGVENAKGLPAIVLPHGGPSARDEWGFDWLSQYFAARGFAVLQPNFRGSAGYGDAWFQNNGFRSWPIAIGDVLDGGRWLIAQGIADPAKLCIVGWSYGGYAALQSAVVDPILFKAVVAIAPVTDLQLLKEERWRWSDYDLVRDFVGEGPHVREGSPALNAAKIKVPVLLFHGALDRNVAIGESKEMAANLAAANVPHELVTWDDLDHQLDDSAARAQMLRKSEEFLRQAMAK
jgi:acetyl esterase/lipase